jgi:hypothetical protein
MRALSKSHSYKLPMTYILQWRVFTTGASYFCAPETGTGSWSWRERAKVLMACESTANARRHPEHVIKFIRPLPTIESGEGRKKRLIGFCRWGDGGRRLHRKRKNESWLTGGTVLSCRVLFYRLRWFFFFPLSLERNSLRKRIVLILYG